MSSAFERIAAKARDIIFAGPNNWQERLQETIEFFSPDGTAFNPKWRGDPRRHEKKLAIYSYPKIKGNVVQDLDVNSTIWTLTFFFDGENNDTDASQFFEATKQTGTWDCVHPVHGFVELNLIDIEEIDNPIESGNITEFRSSWIEPIDPDNLITTREFIGVTEAQANALDETALQQFADKVSAANEAIRTGIDKGVNIVENVSDALLDPIAQIVDEVAATQNAIHDAIQDTNNATVLRVRSLGGQIQALHTNPARVPRSAKEQASTYDDVVSSLGQGLPSTTGPQINATEINSVLTVELAMSAAASGVSRAVINNSGTVTTRAQALNLINDVQGTITNITDLLDGIQELTANAAGIGGPPTIDNQYFSQSQSYTDMILLLTALSQYLLVFSFGLASERRFTLTQPTAPMTIALEQYGDPEQLQFLIDSNGLKGDDIWVLPAGRQVLIYG